MDGHSTVSNFEPFSFDHFVVIGGTLLGAIMLSVFLRRNTSPVRQRCVCIGIACLLVSIEWFNYFYTVIHDGWGYFVDQAMPLHACGVALYLTVFTLIWRRQVTFEMVYFWGFAGTTQALLTPITQAGFPAWSCFHFFLTHGGVIVGVSMLTFGLRMRPRLKGLWITYVSTWLLVLVVGGLNWLLGTNYMYLCAPPTGSTPFYFLPWPWYMLFLGVLALVLFGLLWLPFARSRSNSNISE